MAGALLWSSPGQAQGYCYLVNSDGQVVNLDDLCQSNDAPQAGQSQPATSGVGEAATETQEGTSPGSRSYTITGPAVVPGSSTAPASSAADQPGATGASPGTTPGATDRSPENNTPEAATDPAGVDD
ncbi:hypothetical protein C8B47_20055, partial [filamentous cyanobacterium CCP4]